MEILWNGEVVQTVSPKNYNLEKVNLNLKAKAGDNTLTLRGTGTSDR